MAPSRLDQGTLTILTQTTGDVRVSTSPRLTEGIGEGGLVLVRAVVAESDVVVDPVPVKPPGMFRVVLIRIEIKETRTTVIAGTAGSLNLEMTARILHLQLSSNLPNFFIGEQCAPQRES